MAIGKVKDILKQTAENENEKVNEKKTIEREQKQTLVNQSLQGEIDQLKKSARGRMDNNEETTRVQKILILEYLGILKMIQNDTRKMAKLLSVLLNKDFDNIKKVLEKLNLEKLDSPRFKTENNLKEVIRILNECGYSKDAEQVQKDLDIVSRNSK